jgi:hypothetical protein
MNEKEGITTSLYRAGIQKTSKLAIPEKEAYS